MARNNRNSSKPKSNSSNNKFDKPKNKHEDSKRVENKASAPAISNIIHASSSVAVRNVAGNPVHIPTAQSLSGCNVSAKDFTVPGIVALKFAPVFGVARGSQTDPVNLAARNMWMNLRSLYSNRIPYTAGAIVMYAMALDSILCAFSWLKRAYGVVFAYDARNRYIPDGLLLAMGINPVDFRANLPEIKTFLNKTATQFSAFGVPTELRFIMDHVKMCSHIYMDGATSNAQFIVPVPDFLWQMDWPNNKLKQAAGPVDPAIITGGKDWFSIKTTFTNLIEAFVNNEDVYMIASDMMRLYGSLAQISPVEPDFMIGPEYDETFLMEMHNATWGALFNSAAGSYVNPIWEVSELQAPENVGAIIANYCTKFDIVKLNGSWPTAPVAAFCPGLYDFHTNEPSEEDIVRTTNWKYSLSHVDTASGKYFARIETCGTLLLNGMVFITMEDDSANPGQRVLAQHTVTPQSGGYTSNDLKLIAILKDHPYLPVYEASFGTAATPSLTVEFDGFIGDYDQYVTLDVDEMRRIHEAIVLDRFDAAGVGTLNLHAK